MRGHKLSIDIMTFERLYQDGKNQRELAVACGVSTPQMQNWMRRYGYDSICPKNQQIALRMLYNGATDAEIAEAINVDHINTFSHWRERQKIKANVPRSDGFVMYGRQNARKIQRLYPLYK